MSAEYKKLYRSRNERMLAGVCGGLGEYFNVDPTLMRLLFVLGVVFGFGVMAFVYLAMMIIVPEEPLLSTPTIQPPVEEAPVDSEEESEEAVDAKAEAA
jgi:phage shock protein PspC (stress-responsive transcriptional regulator)